MGILGDLWSKRVANIPVYFIDREWARVDPEPIDDLLDGRLVWAHRVDHAPGDALRELLVPFDIALAKKIKERDRLNSVVKTVPKFGRERRAKRLETHKSIIRESRRLTVVRDQDPDPHMPQEVAPGLCRYADGGWDIDITSSQGWKSYGWLALLQNESVAVYACDVETRRLRGWKADSIPVGVLSASCPG